MANSLSVTEQLRRFVQRDFTRLPSNQWLGDRIMKVYVRRGYHSFKGQPAWALDIANIQVEAQYRGQGRFKEFLSQAHELNPWTATYVQCVHNERLGQHLANNGWTLDPVMTGEPNYYLLKLKQ